MRCPFCRNDDASLLERLADVSAPSEPARTTQQILCQVCAKCFITKDGTWLNAPT